MDLTDQDLADLIDAIALLQGEAEDDDADRLDDLSNRLVKELRSRKR